MEGREISGRPSTNEDAGAPASEEARRLFGRALMLPAGVFASGVELLARLMQAAAGRELDGLISRVTHTLNRDLKEQSRGGETAMPETVGQVVREEDKTMKDKKETLKLVRYKVLFVKRDYETAFPEREELVADDLSTTDFTAWKIAEFIGRLDETKVPRAWVEKNYPRDFRGERSPTVMRLPEGDKKYLRVYYEVLDCYEREEFRYEHKQVKVLEEIRDELRKRRANGGNGKPHRDTVALPKTMCLACALDTAESEFGDEFFNFPDFLGQKPAPGGTKLSGWVEIRFSPPVAGRSRFTLQYFAVGTDDMIQWGEGAQYRLVRNRAFPNPAPFNAQGKQDPTISSGGTLNLKTGEVEGMEMHAIFQNSIIALVDKLNRIPFGFPNDYPPPTLPPGVELPFPDRPPMFVKARFKFDDERRITGFEFHGETIAPVTLFPFMGLFPPFSFGPGGAFYFANPTDCVPGTPPENCPTDETNPDGLHLPMPAFFHPHFDLVTSEVREVPPEVPVPPCLPGGGSYDAVMASVGERLYYIGGTDGGGAHARVRVYNSKSNQWADGPQMPVAVARAQCAVIGKRIYVAGGRTSNGANSNALQVLDTHAGTWSLQANAPTAVAAATAAAVDGKLYVIGGYTNSAGRADSITDRVQVYDPAADSWGEGAAAPLPTADAAAFVADGKIFVASGRTTGGEFTRRVCVYSPIKDKWREGVHTLRAVEGAVAGYLADCAYLVGGKEANAGTPDRGVQIFEFAHNAWRNGIEQPVPTAGSAAALLNGSLYVAGGRIGRGADDDPAAAVDALQVFSPVLGWGVCQSTPLFTADDIFNSASLTVGRRSLSPGCRASVVGYGFATAPAVAPPGADAPTNLGGVSITVDGRHAPILSVTPGRPGLPDRVDFQVPYSVSAPKSDTRRVKFELRKDGAKSQAPAVEISLRATTPGIFIHNFGEAREYNFLHDATALACNEDGTLNYPAQPATPNEVVTLYLTGLGRVTPEPANGARSGDGPTNKVAAKPAVTIGGITAEVVSVVLAPHSVGLYEVRARVPAKSQKSNNVRVEVSVGDVKSNRASISVQAKSRRAEPPVPCELGKKFILNE